MMGNDSNRVSVESCKGWGNSSKSWGNWRKKGSPSPEQVGKGLKGVYGFSVKVVPGGEGLKVEPFGNIGQDKATGESVVHELREPMVDVFEEADHVLVVAEMPGIGSDDVRVEIRDDVLILSAEKGDKKYRKEVLLPQSFSRENLKISCQSGILQVKCMK